MDDLDLAGSIMEEGIEQKPADPEELSQDRQVTDAKEGRKTLADLSASALVTYVKRRVKRLDKPFKEKLAVLKVNWLRYKGYAFVQVHPSNNTQIWAPPVVSRRAPTINKIERGVDRYVAQITADKPVMEGVPASHKQEDRDAAEASTAAIRSEWQRMKLNAKLQRSVTFSAVMRSSFWFFQWDPSSGDTQPAMKYFKTQNGDRVLLPVGSDGKRVSSVADAARIRSGNMTVKILTPANVRWAGGERVDDATEVMVTEVLKLRDVFEQLPSTRKAKVRDLLDGDDKPVDAMDWMTDIKANEFGRDSHRSAYDDSYAGDAATGESIAPDSGVLDEPVVVTHYFRKRGGDYPNGYHVITAGGFKVYAGTLRYGIIPLTQFKFLDDLMDELGRALVDILKDPQELLDFVNGQVLRYLQMLKRRWFVPIYSNVKARDLLSPTRSIIEYNPAGGAPTPEVNPEIPNSMVEFVQRFDEDFRDQIGLHATSEGKHIPGVGSGRHAEALRSADETLLGLTRIQIIQGLERAGVIMLAIIKKEWKQERRCRFFGDDRAYVDMAFRSADFGDTTEVVLQASTLLMLTPAQRLETIMTWAETGLLGKNEIRLLAPLNDVAGISLTENKHYQRARRQNTRFLMGPPEELVTARKQYETALEGYAKNKSGIDQAAGLGMPGQTVEVAMNLIASGMAATEMTWQEMTKRYAFNHEPWEDNTNIARIHAEVHAEALASDKAEMFPDWWRDLFTQHAVIEWKIGFPEQQPSPPPPEQAAGGTPAKRTALGGANNAKGQPPAQPEGLTGATNQPGPVQGQAP